MALLNETEAIMEALSAVSGVASVTRGWPRANAAYPCVLVGEASNAPARYCDDSIMLCELEYDVRIFDKLSARKEKVASDVDDVMLGLGFERVLVYDDTNADVRMKVMRYRGYRQEPGAQ